jgi:hypothetical protein
MSIAKKTSALLSAVVLELTDEQNWQIVRSQVFSCFQNSMNAKVAFAHVMQSGPKGIYL